MKAMVFNVLRPAEQTLITAEIMDDITRAMQFGPDAAAGLKSRVRANLFYLAGVRVLIVKDGERERATWRIAE